MPVPRFVPIIAGGSDPFGGIAQQELAWAGFSAGREDANARRLQEAEQSQNNYLARLAQMQREDAARADSLAVADRRTAADFIVGERRAREQGRQFDTSVELQKADQALKSKMFDFNSKRQDQEKADMDAYINDLGETMAPHVAEVGDAFEKSQAALQAADVAMRAGNSKWQAELPGATWNAKTGQFEFRNSLGHVVPPPAQYVEKAQAAAADMASMLSGYDNAVRESDTAKREWYALHNDLSKQGLPPIKIDGVWSVRSPKLKKTFQQTMKDAGVKTGNLDGDLSAGAEIGARPTTLSWNNPDGGAGAGNDLGAWKMPAGFDSPVADQAPTPAQAPAAPPTFTYANGNLTPASQSPVSASAPVADAPGGFVPVSPTAPVAAAGPAAVDPNFRVPKFNSPDDILKLYRAGAITLTEAKKLAQSEFNGYLGDLAFETEERKQENPDVYKWRPWRK